MGIPGLKMVAPMTSNEVNDAWDDWESGSDPILFSEHRRSYTEEEVINDRLWGVPDVTIFACSASRVEAINASKILHESGYKVSVIGIVNMQPWELTPTMEHSVNCSEYVLSMDSSYIPGGIAEHVAYSIMHKTGKKVDTMGMTETPAASMDMYRGTPTAAEIIKKIQENIG
jgi:pyruvate/2-oxoglutarate/acetoin dehydrogenase E1 component